MAPRVRILPEQLTNKIAAGEVVERPASVVKELVENAIDASATEIIVEIEDGGRRLIRVADDGSGMCREDLLIALERHATSKIRSDADLFRIASLGFRGEALPSIASVSRCSLASRVRDSIEGTEVYVEGGRINEVKSCGMPPGTIVAVRNLFFNTPARLKFMKSKDTETGHVGELFNRLALSRPDIRFTYAVDGRMLQRLPAADLPARAKALFSKEVAGELRELDYRADGISLKGLLGTAAVSRSTSGSMYTYINGRFVRDKVVQHAIMQGYRNLLERGRYPVVVLFLELLPDDVDVNVHPTKHEVRFREQARIHGLIQQAIEARLQKSSPALAAAPVFSGGTGAGYGQTSATSRVTEVKEALLRYASVPHPAPASRGFSDAPAADERLAPQLPEAQPDTDAAASEFSALKIIGQYRSAYILCEDGQDLLIIDQHAAHERIVFQQLRAACAVGTVAAQRLLFPEPLELSPIDSATLKLHAVTLRQLAFEVEEFGQATWLLTAIPALLATGDYRQALLDILSELGTIGSSAVFAEKRDQLLATVACHSSVRGSWQLSPPELRALLQQMDATDFAAHCPHGRPVVGRIPLRDIEKLFKR